MKKKIRYRTVACLIWNDDKFPFEEDDVQLVWFHVRTSMLSNPLGCYKASIEALAAEKRWTLIRYRRAFNRGIKVGFWKYDKRHQVVWFKRHFYYNEPTNPNVLKHWLKCWDEIPACSLRNEMLASLLTYSKGWGEPFAKVCETFAQTFAKQ